MDAQSPIQTSEAKYVISVSPENKTGLKLYSVFDPFTGITISIPDTGRIDIPTFFAATGARYSRFVGTVVDLYKDIYGRKISPAEFIQRILSYGHGSVAEMAEIPLNFEGISQLMAFRIFSILPTGAGQEKSTRYVPWEEEEPFDIRNVLSTDSIEDSEIIEIEQKYHDIFKTSKELYNKWQELVQSRLENYIESKSNDHPEGISIQAKKSSLIARTLDIARRFLLMGNRTSMMYQANIRIWNDLITYMDASPDIMFRALGEQIKFTLQIQKAKPEFSGNYSALMKYKETDDTIFKNLDSLKDYLVTIEDFQKLRLIDVASIKESTVSRIDLQPEEAIVFQYIKALQPNLDNDELIKFIKTRNHSEQNSISEIIYRNHHKHNRMREIGDIKGSLYEIFAPLADLRDFNRHRAAGRMTGIWHTQDIRQVLKSRFGENYQLFQSDYLSDLREIWEKDIAEFYKKIDNYIESIGPHINDNNRYSLTLNCLPLGHRAPMQMSFPPSQLPYFLNLRGVHAYEYEKGKSFGGDFSYMRIAEMLFELIRQRPYMSGLLGKDSSEREVIDPNKIKQILGRS